MIQDPAPACRWVKGAMTEVTIGTRESCMCGAGYSRRHTVTGRRGQMARPRQRYALLKRWQAFCLFGVNESAAIEFRCRGTPKD